MGNIGPYPDLGHRNREGDDFKDAEARARHRAGEARDRPGGVAGAGRIKNGGLLDGAAHLAHAGDFKSVADAAAEFLFRPAHSRT